MQQKEAETYAVRAVEWLAQDAERFGPLLGVSGVGPRELRERLDDPVFLSFVIDYVMSADWMVLAYADYVDISPETVQKIAMVLRPDDEKNQVEW